MRSVIINAKESKDIHHIMCWRPNLADSNHSCKIRLQYISIRAFASRLTGDSLQLKIPSKQLKFCPNVVSFTTIIKLQRFFSGSPTVCEVDRKRSPLFSYIVTNILLRSVGCSEHEMFQIDRRCQIYVYLCINFMLCEAAWRDIATEDGVARDNGRRVLGG